MAATILPTSERDAMIEALKQIAVVCADNAGPNCDQAMALKFVRDVALAALAKAGEAP